MYKMRVFLIGCETISVEMLKALLEHERFEVVGVASKDHLEQMKAYHEMGEPSLVEEAGKHGVPVYMTDDVNSIEKKLQSLNLDYLFCGSWSRLLNRRVLKIPKIGCFNIHPSLLPKNRGCMPVHWAIINGNYTGVTIHKMAAGADNGAIVKQVKYIIPPTMNVKALTKVLWNMGAELFKECLDAFADETFTLTLQDEALATHHPKGLPYGGVLDPNWIDMKKIRFRRAMDYSPFENIKEPERRVLILSPHGDDAEIGCGASIAKYIENGAIVKVVAFAEQQTTPNHSNHQMRQEFYTSMKKLKVTEFEMLYYEARYLEPILPELTNVIYTKILSFNPDILYIPSLKSRHEDHIAIASAAHRASGRMNISVLGYHILGDGVGFAPTHFEVVEKRHMLAKIAALRCYKSQHDLRSFFSDANFEATLRFYATMTGHEYIEPFEAIKWISE